jgi:hypothetical protein
MKKQSDTRQIPNEPGALLEHLLAYNKTKEGKKALKKLGNIIRKL